MTSYFGSSVYITSGLNIDGDSLCASCPSISFTCTTGTLTSSGSIAFTGSIGRTMDVSCASVNFTGAAFNVTGTVRTGTINADGELYVNMNSSHGNVYLSRASDTYEATIRFRNGITNMWLLGMNAGQSDSFELYGYGANGYTLRSNYSTGHILMPKVYSCDIAAGNTRDLYIKDDGTLGYLSSSIQRKMDVKSANDFDWLHSLRVVSFKYKKPIEHKDGSYSYLDESVGPLHVGFVAEEVSKTIPEEIHDGIIYKNNLNGSIDGMSYTALIPPMVGEIQQCKTETNMIIDDIMYLKTSMINFIGQHRCKPIVDTLLNPIYIGRCVISTGRIDDIPQPDETLPIVELSTEYCQSSVYGVISDIESIGEFRDYPTESSMIRIRKKSISDRRLVINTSGGGGLWVDNTFGFIRNGDYVVSYINGYTTKQNDDTLHSYTVAKILMDCDFELDNSTYKCIELDEYINESRSKFLATRGKIKRRIAFLGCTYCC